MTVGEMRRLMLKKVVPEKVIPQNIVDFLVDENAELAEPDTYTFLQRLRGLGVGSADFVYLLEGCGAPEMAVSRIKANPAMNLQSLILTLETSGMTSKDYMRILFTARQIWERTLSTRLERVEAAVEGNLDSEKAESAGVEYKNRIEDEEPDEDDDFSAALQALNEETEKALREQTPSTEETAEFADTAYEAEDNADSTDTQSAETDNTIGFYVGGTEEFESLLGGSIPEDYAQPVKPTIEDEDFENFEDFAFEEQSSSESAEQDIPEEAVADDDIAPVAEGNFVKDRKHFTVQIDYSDLQTAQAEQTESEAKKPAPKDKSDLQLELSENNLEDSFFDAQEFDDKPAYPVTAEENSSEQEQTSGAYNGDTTAIIAIDRAMLEENLANIASLSDIAGSIGNDDDNDDDGGKDEEKSKENSEEKSDKQTKKSDSKSEKFEVHIAEIDDEYDDDYDYINSRSRYYSGALTAASVGAIVVVGCGVMAGMVFGMTPPDPIGYAENESEIFTEIYHSYNEKIAGGDSYYGYSLQNVDIFGDLLVTQEGFGTFTDGDNVYTVTAEEITINKFAEGALQFVGTLSAPEDTRIVDAVKLEGDALCAVFDGDVCGYMKVSGGTLAYTVRQDGRLTDFVVDENGEICIGSLYTPKFYENFTVADVEVYLPKLGTEYVAMPATSVIPSRIKGYSYGVSAAYSAINGKTLRADAVLGNPVFASADGQFALNGAETGLLIKVDYSEVGNAVTAGTDGTASMPSAASQATSTTENTETIESTENVEEKRPAVYTAECGKLSGIAFFDGGSAALESGKVTLRDKEFTAITVLENFSSIPDKMVFRGNTLLVSDKNRVFLAMDCSNLASPKPLTLRQATGKVGESVAVTVEQTAEGIRVADYTLGADGIAVLKHSNMLQLNGEQRGTLKIADSSCIVADGELHGAAYSYFDGVSVIWEYTALADSPKRAMLYDDKTGITLAFPMNGKVYAQSARGLIEIT